MGENVGTAGPGGSAAQPTGRPSVFHITDPETGQWISSAGTRAKSLRAAGKLPGPNANTLARAERARRKRAGESRPAGRPADRSQEGERERIDPRTTRRGVEKHDVTPPLPPPSKWSEATVAETTQKVFFAFSLIGGDHWNVEPKQAKQFAKALIDCEDRLPTRLIAKVNTLAPPLNLAFVGLALVVPRVIQTIMLKRMEAQGISPQAPAMRPSDPRTDVSGPQPGAPASPRPDVGFPPPPDAQERAAASQRNGHYPTEQGAYIDGAGGVAVIVAAPRIGDDLESRAQQERL